MNRREFSNRLAAGVAALALPGVHRQAAPPRVSAERIHAHLAALSEFGKNPEGGVSRVAYSEADLAARPVVRGWMDAARLETSIDTAGNIIGRRPGRDPALRPLVLGSHIDSVPMGGNFDGTVGVLSAIEVARTLDAAGITLRHPLEVMIFQNEEGGTVGSQAIAAGLSTADLDRVAQSGRTISEGIRLVGGDPDRLAESRRQPGDIAGYLELHIEQGGVLEQRGLQIGVVLGIVGIRQWDITIEGFGNHAGTTPMNARRDALLVAARCIDAVNRVIVSVPGRQVGTVGKIQVLPGAYNVIPGRVIFGLEQRDLDDTKIQSLHRRIIAECTRIARAGGTTLAERQVRAISPALTAPAIRNVIGQAAGRLGLTSMALPSGAGHDAQKMAELGPVGMIFIPSKDGISHSPKEYSAPADIENGANVLLQALLRLDQA
jgi:beta-ureidopropionase / N-carbamoyl-L-amino-acid hydrolase